MKREFPRHLARLEGGTPTHNIIISAHVAGEHRLYTIDMTFSDDRAHCYWRYTRHVLKQLSSGHLVTHQLALGGSGGQLLERDPTWLRPLRRLASAHDRELIHAQLVADHLASLAYDVHLRAPDKSVGPRCIVAWRNTRDGPRRGGGGQCCYTARLRDATAPILPTIARGMDVRAIVEVMLPHIRSAHDEAFDSDAAPNLDIDALNADARKLPEGPDEHLR